MALIKINSWTESTYTVFCYAIHNTLGNINILTLIFDYLNLWEKKGKFLRNIMWSFQYISGKYHVRTWLW